VNDHEAEPVQRANYLTRLDESGGSSTSFRALANAAARALAQIYPGATVLLLRNYSDDDSVKVVGGANVPEFWQKRVLDLKDVPPIAQAFSDPSRVVHKSVRFAPVASDHQPPEPQEHMQSLCGAIQLESSTRYALMLIAPRAPEHTAARMAALDAARKVLAAVHSRNGDKRQQTLAAIYRAKLEWELSVDALPEIVGLLDSSLKVVRISRAIERWHLGTVGLAIGRGLHALLHPNCQVKECALLAQLRIATDKLRFGSAASFELTDAPLSRDLIVALTPPLHGNSRDGMQRAPRTVFTVADVTVLRRAEREINKLNQNLEARVAERTDELVAANRTLLSEVRRRRAAERSLRRSMRDLEALSERLMTAQEAERKRISQDLHDSVGQNLSAIKYSLERAQVLTRRGAPDEAGKVVDAMVVRVQSLLDEVRAISMNLRPAVLDDLGAASAVRGLCRGWQDVYHGIDIDLDIGVKDADIPEILVTNVYRAVQESLNNVARHAGASHVEVSMRILSGVLTVKVCDDGIGFTVGEGAAATEGTRGLRGLKERAESTGGRFDVLSAPGKGTTIRLEWPVAAGHAARLANASLN
jgi:signal transduction histidine kinase